MTADAPAPDRPQTADDSGPAAVQAARAARSAGVRVLPLDTLDAVRSAAALFARVWRTDPDRPPLSAEVVRAVEHAGGYAVGAYRDGRLVGASVGFLGLHGRSPVLHSHISGVTEPGRGTGLAVKLHQRAWALDRGLPTITWTFDPLVRRNAWFNLSKLGAVGVEYLVDFYGPMTDGVNSGESSDRLFTRWDLTAVAALPLPPGALPLPPGAAPLPPGAAPPDGAVVLLDERGGAPEVLGAAPDDAAALLVRLPADVEGLRRTAPATARAWRTAVRDVLVPAFADGWRARGTTPDGWLVLAR